MSEVAPETEVKFQRRVTRQQTRSQGDAVLSKTSACGDSSTLNTCAKPRKPDQSNNSSGFPELLPSRITATQTRLSRADHKLLLYKHEILRNYDIAIPANFGKHSAAVEATLVFAQEQAGTAVCISPEGHLITCAHCVAESEEELDLLKPHWLIFASGRVVSAKCIAWDDRRDLALLQITAAQAAPGQEEAKTRTAASDNSTESPVFPYAPIATHQLPLGAKLVCVGHPGSEDLEASQAGVKTNYDVLHLSTGEFLGYALGQDIQDNSEIGASQHDCWTYWGHSGAPLLGRKDGQLVGLHSSWDDQTAMRRGVPLEAIREFLEIAKLRETTTM